MSRVECEESARANGGAPVYNEYRELIELKVCEASL